MLRSVYLFGIFACTCAIATAQTSIETSLATLNNVGNAGVRHREAIAAWQSLANVGGENIPQLIKAIDEKKPLSANWIRAAVDQVAERSLQNGRERWQTYGRRLGFVTKFIYERK